MKEIYLKITIAVMFVICTVLIGIAVLINSNAYSIRKHISGLEKKNDELVKKIRKPSERFYFVTKNQARVLNETKDDTTTGQIVFEIPEEIKTQGKNLAEQVSEKTPAAVRDIFLAHLAGVKEEAQLLSDKAQHLLKDQDTALLEEMCNPLNMEVSTKLCWDMQNQERICISTVSMKKTEKEIIKKNAAPLPEPVSFSYRRRNANPAKFYCQDGIHTIVLGFEPITLPDHADRELTRPYFQIPVGGHYTHLIEVRRAENSKAQYWYLEYEVPLLAEESEKKANSKDPEKEIPGFHMNAISLLPGSPVVSISSGSIQTFRVPFVNGVSKLLISADKVVFPKSLIATPHNKNGDAFGK